LAELTKNDYICGMEKLLNFDFQLLNQGFSKLDATWNFGPICSRFTRIYYVSEGEGWVSVGISHIEA
jgi:hypothetical protein